MPARKNDDRCGFRDEVFGTGLPCIRPLGHAGYHWAIIPLKAHDATSWDCKFEFGPRQEKHRDGNKK